MLQHTWKRVEMIAPRERVLTVVDAGHGGTFRNQLASRAHRTVIYQPTNRETAPGTLLPLAHVLRADPSAIVGIFPSDHFILEEERFMAQVQLAAWSLQRGMWDVVVLGVAPDQPDPDYGWIEVSRAGRHPGSGLLPVERFWEKPHASVARSLYEGGHLWSTMVTVARATTLWRLICEAQPELHRPFERIRHALGTAAETAEISSAYEGLPSASLSGDVFARTPSRLAALAVREVHWSDWGREERIDATLRQLGEYNKTTDASRPVAALT
jgi:mannose-1-phosphate guanylyltransferase